MLPSISPLLLLGASLFSHLAAATTIISTFSDDNCQDSLNSLDGPNGYPNGTCTPLDRDGTYNSFQVVGVDPGCVVSIYEKDTDDDICSGFVIAVYEIAQCYNATWVYYSIDGCTSPSDLSTTVSGSAPTSTDTSSASSSGSSSDSTSHTGAIVGGVVGGVLGLAAIVAATVYFTRRQHNKKTDPPMYESAMAQVSEMHAETPKELPAAPEVYEKMAHEPEAAPVELPGEDLESRKHHGSTP